MLISLRSLVQAKTGTGKTVAFLLPAIQNTILNRPSKGLVSVLVMSPTRELALQIAAEAKLLVSKLQPTLEVHTAFGGSAKASNLSKFKRGDPKILIATPGRLKDYLSETEVQTKFKSMKTLVLDEADRMLDQGRLGMLPGNESALIMTEYILTEIRIPPGYSQHPQSSTLQNKWTLARHVLLRNYTSKDEASLLPCPRSKSYPHLHYRPFRAAHAFESPSILNCNPQRHRHFQGPRYTTARRD